MSVKHNGKTIASNPKFHPDLLEFKWSDHLLNDPQWLRADTFSQQYKSVYGPAYDHLADDIVGKTLQSETVAGTTVQFYLADDGHKICPVSEESNVSAIYNATGEAWYYIIDTTNQWFKLPRRHSQEIVQSVKNADGSWYRLYADGWVEQGGKANQPNSTSDTGASINISLPVEMADNNYAVLTTGSVIIENGGTGGGWAGMRKASSSTTTTLVITSNRTVSSIVFNWQVSGQSAIDMSSFQGGEKHLYFYVGNFTQTAIENTAGINAELFNDKADITAVAGLAAPASNSITLPIPATTGGGGTADKDGYLYVNGKATGSSASLSIVNTANGLTISTFPYNNYDGCLYIPIAKGQQYAIWWNNLTVRSVKLIPLKGAQ